MKKKMWKKVLCLGITACMTLALAACGNKENGGGGSGNSSGNSSENSELAKQYVYSYETISMQNTGDYFSIRDISLQNDQIYVVADSSNWSSEINSTEYRLVSFKTDGSNLQETKLDMGEQPGMEEGGGNPNIYLGTITMGGDSCVYGVLYENVEDYSDPENPIFENKSYLAKWDQSGAQVWKKSLDELKGETAEYFNINDIVSGSDGNIHMLCGGDKFELISLDMEGNVLTRNPVDDNLFSNSGVTYLKEDGTIFLSIYNEDWTKLSFTTYDPSTGTTGEMIEAPGTISMYNIYPGTVTDLLLTNSNGVYTYNMGDAEAVQIMSYVNSDLAASYLNNVLMIDDAHFVADYPDNETGSSQLAIFTKVDPKDIPDKSVLVLGAVYLDGNVRQRIVDFNKTSDKYRITVRDYSGYSTADDYLAGYTKLNNDIIAGDMPDILVVDEQMPVSNYVSKGLLADVGSLLEKDEELAGVEFMQNVFDAYSFDGKMYYVLPSFSVETFVGKKSILGDREGWTMAEMMELMSQMPEGTQSFGDMTRDIFMQYYVMEYSGSDFVDPSTGKCNFNSEEFINLLEFAKTLPEEINYDYDNDQFWRDMETQYRDNRTILMPLNIYRIDNNMNYNIQANFGEDITFIGFPNENRKGSVIRATQSFVISSKSKNMEGAWEFLRYYLTDEYQNSEKLWGMPVQKKAFMTVAQKATEKPKIEDENGNMVEASNTYYFAGEEIEVEPMSQAQLDQIIAFVESVNRPKYNNSEITKIMEEEMAAFFSGQKIAADVAEIIQRRAQIYVDENR